LRPEVRAAIALEEAGELQEAARVFEHAGEYAQAAALRLEYAQTVGDRHTRLDILREGCARNRGDAPQVRALQLALAGALLQDAETTEVGARRRSLELEAAEALETAGQPTRAGEIYERLGLLERAAEAYKQAGEIARFELVLELLERKEQRAIARKAVQRDALEAIEEGRRRYAHSILTDHLRHGTAPDAPLIALFNELEGRLLRQHRVEFGWKDGRVTTVRGTDRIRIGRSPGAELSLPKARLSRFHAELRLQPDHDGTPRVVAMDLGSKTGTFWDGEPLRPGEPVPLVAPGELALGMSTQMQVHPVHSPQGIALGALVAIGNDGRAWHLFLPRGGPLWLSPDIQLPARLVFEPSGFVVVDFARAVRLTLRERALPMGAAIDLMLGDRICMVDVPLVLEVLG
jgi:hypothetical protein